MNILRRRRSRRYQTVGSTMRKGKVIFGKILNNINPEPGSKKIMKTRIEDKIIIQKWRIPRREFGLSWDNLMK